MLAYNWDTAGVIDWRDRLRAYSSIIEGWRHAPSFSVLEIGVMTGSLTEHLRQHFGPDIARYLAVDPYLGTPDDPYFHGYWKGQQANAESTYVRSKALCERLGVELVRQTSDQYFASSGETFDVVIVDGDHSEKQCLVDLVAARAILNPGGLLLCDDYGNPDHPGVTKAACKFDAEHGSEFRDVGCRYIYFNKPERRIPYPLGIAYWIR